MIKEETIFVLGAGASIPYGMPSGKNLILNISRNLSNRNYIEQLVNEEFTEGDIKRFSEALRSSSTPSIDLFLKNRPEFTKLGKTLIVQDLITFEKSGSVINFKTDWLSYLWQLMISDHSPQEFTQNRISFITFNYDRILEYFLFTSLQNMFGLSDDDTNNILREIPIFHVFGKLGNLPWEGSEKYRLLENNIGNYNNLVELSESIITIYEYESKLIKNDIFKLLSNAKRIYFLGFAYHSLNVLLLRLDELDNDKYISGTTFGLRRQEIGRIKNIVPGKLINICNYDSLDIYNYMREEMLLN